MAEIRAVLTDIEGTTTPIAFVRDTLFPFARERLSDFLAVHGDEPEVAALVAETRSIAPGQDPLAALLEWMDADAKVTPLKALQGLIWDEGYQQGLLRGQLYPDVAPALRQLHQDGLKLYVYSSGSAHAQRLIFGHSVDGDLTPLFSGFFDTTIGGKRSMASYHAIAAETGHKAAEILFLSDVAEELEAARAAGCLTMQLVREADGTVPAPGFEQAATFDAVLARLSPA